MGTDTIKSNIVRLVNEESNESILLAIEKLLEDSTLRNIYEQRAKHAEADIEANRLYDIDEIRKLTDRYIQK